MANIELGGQYMCLNLVIKLQLLRFDRLAANMTHSWAPSIVVLREWPSKVVDVLVQHGIAMVLHEHTSHLACQQALKFCGES